MLRATMRRILALSLTLLLPATVVAQNTDDDLARAHFDSGSAYYEQGRYDDAAREFIESYRLSPQAALLENVARAQERGLHFEEAIATLERLLAEHPDYPQATAVRDRIRSYGELRDRLASHGGSGGAQDATAEPIPSGTAPPASSADDSGGGGVSVPGVILLAAGGAMGLTSIITGAMSQATFDQLADECAGVCPADRQGEVDTGETLALVSTILMFPSIIAIGVGVVLLIVDGGGGGERADLEVVPGPGDGGVAVRGRF